MDMKWREVLRDEFASDWYKQLRETLEIERATYQIYPRDFEEFAALDFTPFDDTRVVILGQDPYHGRRQAQGLSFSVHPGTPHPPSLRNIFKELHDDVGVPIPSEGTLIPWAEQGVLLLNTTLTVRKGEAGSHHGLGWEKLTDAMISALNERSECCVFVLWGAHARKKKSLITSPQHTVIESAHPSPLSAHNGFFGSKPFSQVNRALLACGHDPINWSLL